MTEPSTIIISENRFKGVRPAKLILRDPSLFDISVADEVEDLSIELTKQKLIKVLATIHSPDHFIEFMSQATNKGWLQTKDANWLTWAYGKHGYNFVKGCILKAERLNTPPRLYQTRGQPWRPRQSTWRPQQQFQQPGSQGYQPRPQRPPSVQQTQQSFQWRGR
eukprot:Blabericola_migrator_1__8857@NODE_4684_length_1022_cov_1311_283770_g2913_i0_p1_GENE_NODE_4684_length_1022_cov_1311_283770_g2913_i0NODE_4684_length_1022_cov_1311_283770_g2913_i0_p1_ORF_typecomplete_len180_score24_73_NODE_4684_length_1022_cov_1311_283770_g2913_i051542